MELTHQSIAPEREREIITPEGGRERERERERKREREREIESVGKKQRGTEQKKEELCEYACMHETAC